MFRLAIVIIRLIQEPFNISQVLFCAFGIPYALHRIILWGNLSTNTIVCNVRHVVWAMLFAGRCSSTSWLSAGAGGGSSYCFIHLRSCLSLLIVLVRSLYCFLWSFEFAAGFFRVVVGQVGLLSFCSVTFLWGWMASHDSVETCCINVTL